MANNILYVSDGDYGTPAGYMLPLMQGQYGQSVPLEIRDLAGNVVNLTGYTFTATKKKGGSVTAWVGSIVLSATPSAAPQVTLTVDQSDTGTDGGYDFFIEGTNGSQVLKTHPVSLTIVKDPAVNATAAPGLVSVTTAQKALLATISTLTGLVKMAAGTATGIAVQAFMETFLGSANAGVARANLLPSYTSNANKVLTVNSGATDVEWATPSSGSGDLLAANNLSELTATAATARTNIGAAAASDLAFHEGANTNVHGITDTSALLTTGEIGSTVQAYSAKTAAIAALTWAANNIILLTGTATASVQALAAHVVTFIQSASAADARTAIGAGTGNGDLLAANNLNDVTASTARTNLAVPGLADANTFTAHNLFQTTDAVTNATTIGITLEHQSSGTPATVFGSSIKFLLESTTTAGRDAALIDARWATATDATRLCVLELSAYYTSTKTSIQIYPMTSGSYARIVWGSNADQGLWRENNEQVISGASVGFKSFNGSAYVFSARVDGSVVAGDTRLLIYDVDNAAIERVSVGIADSGGSGYKVLRIPN